MTADLQSQSPQATWIEGRRVAFAGKLASFSHREAGRVVAQRGGIIVGLDDPELQCVVVGEETLSANAADSRRALRLNSLSPTVEQISETELWSRLGMLDTEGHRSAGLGPVLYTLPMLAQILDVPVQTVRRWQRRGLLIPVRQVNRLPYFDFSQITLAKSLIRLLAEGGKASGTIETKLSRFAQGPNREFRSLSDLDVVVDGPHVLVRDQAGLADVSGQLHLDFYSLDTEAEVAHPEVLSFSEIGASGDPESQAYWSIDQFLQQALTFEDNHEPVAAMNVYRKLAQTHGPSPDTCFAMAELLYGLGELPAARERYQMAIELDPAYIEAYANLGCLLAEMEDLEGARNAFETALGYHPNYPDVHFHLAKALDQLELADEAEQHWRQFLELAPSTPWSEEARQRLQR